MMQIKEYYSRNLPASVVLTEVLLVFPQLEWHLMEVLKMLDASGQTIGDQEQEILDLECRVETLEEALEEARNVTR